MNLFCSCSAFFAKNMCDKLLEDRSKIILSEKHHLYLQNFTVSKIISYSTNHVFRCTVFQ